jgi:hypothetical protein
MNEQNGRTRERGGHHHHLSSNADPRIHLGMDKAIQKCLSRWAYYKFEAVHACDIRLNVDLYSIFLLFLPGLIPQSNCSIVYQYKDTRLVLAGWLTPEDGLEMDDLRRSFLPRR